MSMAIKVAGYVGIACGVCLVLWVLRLLLQLLPKREKKKPQVFEDKMDTYTWKSDEGREIKVNIPRKLGPIWFGGDDWKKEEHVSKDDVTRGVIEGRAAVGGGGPRRPSKVSRSQTSAALIPGGKKGNLGL